MWARELVGVVSFVLKPGRRMTPAKVEVAVSLVLESSADFSDTAADVPSFRKKQLQKTCPGISET